MFYKILSILLLIAFASFPQEKDQFYSLSAEAGAGYAYFLTDLDNPDLNQGGYSGTFRVMWHPEHLLSLGIETGYWRLYSLEGSISTAEYGSTTSEVSMISVPVMGVFSMKVFPEMLPDLEIKFLTGILLLTNNINAYGVEQNSSLMSIGFAGAATYLVPLNDIISLGGELKYHYISKIQDADLSLQVMFSYSFLHY
jgi:hypothetical protein